MCIQHKDKRKDMEVPLGINASLGGLTPQTLISTLWCRNMVINKVLFALKNIGKYRSYEPTWNRRGCHSSHPPDVPVVPALLMKFQGFHQALRGDETVPSLAKARKEAVNRSQATTHSSSH